MVQCKWNCKANHEHYVGTYERAIQYFGVNEDEIKNYGNLINIIIYQQTSQQTVRKFSNELYDILISAMSEHKYWVPAKDRHKTALETLTLAKKKGYIMDDLIAKTIKSEKYKDNLKQQRRLYMYEKWIDNNSF